MAATPVPGSTPNMPWLPTGQLPQPVTPPNWHTGLPNDPN
jgi:hypothetical protein